VTPSTLGNSTDPTAPTSIEDVRAGAVAEVSPNAGDVAAP
jgi:hypothetical protein